MKTASMVLGIVGGTLAIIGGLYMVFMVIPNMSAMLLSIPGANAFVPNDEITDVMFDTLTAVYTALGKCICLGGVLGLIGGIIVKSNNAVGRVFMIIGTVVGCLNLLLLVGAIFAFICDKQPVPQYVHYMPYPGQPQDPPRDKIEQ